MQRIEASSARYIKLGRGGKWERLCIRDGTLRFGYADVPHGLAMEADKERLRQFFVERSDPPSAAANHANQVFDFYHADPVTTLWITFCDGFLWWCVAQPGVEYVGTEGGVHEEQGARLRRAVAGWHNRSIQGTPLRTAYLNGALTKVAAYQMTICGVKPLDYLLRRINDEDLPAVTEAKQAKNSVLASIRSLMQLLQWADFELLVDLVFAQSGWRRVGENGGTQKTVDIELVLPSTGERSFVQVKSRTDQAQLNDYVERLARRDDARMFYVYHSGPAELACSDPRGILVGPDRLAEMVLTAGLFDWLLTKAG